MALSESDRLFGNKAVELEFITPKQLERVLELKEKLPDKKLGEILMAKGFISNREVKAILKELGEKDGLKISQFDTYFWHLKLQCTCGKKVLFPGNLMGGTGTCPQCLQKIVIPAYENPEILGFVCHCGTKLPQGATICTHCQGRRPPSKITQPSKPTASAPARITKKDPSPAPVLNPLTPLAPEVEEVPPPKALAQKPLQVLTPEPVVLAPESPQVLTPDPTILPEKNTPKGNALSGKLKTAKSISATSPRKSASSPILEKLEAIPTKPSALETEAQADLLEDLDHSEQASDRQFARICLRIGLATQNQIQEALNEQQQSLKTTGNFLKLGQILIRKGVISVQDFLKIVAEQKKNVIECSHCHAMFQLKEFQPNARLRCHHCKMIIELPESLEAIPSSQQTVHASLGTVTPGASALRASQTVDMKPLGFKESGLIGKTIGKYEIIQELGRGGMGVVFKARDTVLNRVVAMKILKEGDGASEEQIRRFQKEAEAMGKIRHPLIVPIYDYGQIDDLHFFTMEYIQGRTLDDHIDRRAFSQAKCVKILHDLAEAIHAAHVAGVIHRDLKPSNVIIDEEGNPHIMDFGLAKDVELKSKLTRTGAQVGTPYYMSPEQARGEKKISPSVDLYALGVIFYEMLTGRVPFTGQNQAEVYHKIIHKAPRSLRSINSKISADLEVMVSRLLMKYPEDRYPTAQDLAEDLARFMEHIPIQAKRDTLLTKSLRFLRHNGKIVFKFTVALIFFSGTLLFLFYFFVVKDVDKDSSRKITELQKQLDDQKQQQTSTQKTEDSKRLIEIRKNIDSIIAELRSLTTKPGKDLQFRLVQLNDDEEIAYLATFLKDSDQKIREMVASAFIRIGKVKAAPYMVEALKTAEDPDEISTYLTAMGMLKYNTAIPIVFKYLEHPRRKVRDVAISSISMLDPDRQYLPTLIEMLRTNKDTRLRSLLILVMTKTYPFPEVHNPLKECLEDPDMMIQEMSIQAMGELQVKDSIPQLGKIAKFHTNPSIRKVAAIALGKIGDAQAIPFLKDVLKDDNLYVVTKAAAALQKLHLGKPNYDEYKRLESKIDEKLALIQNLIAQTITFRKRGEFAQALETIEKAKEISASADVYLQRGRVYLDMREISLALKDFQNAQKYDPFKFEASFALAELYMRQGKPNHALEEVSKALEINPRDEDGLKLRAGIYQKMGKQEEALEDLKTNLVFSENEAEAYTLLAEMYFMANDPAKALENYEMALKSDPEYIKAYESRAMLYLEENKYEKALENLDKALKINSRSTVALTYRGDIYRRQKRYTQAIADFSLVLSIDPSDVDATVFLGEMMEEQTKVPEAIKYYSQALDLTKKNPVIFIKRGAALIRIQEFEAAIRDYQEANKLDPTLQQPYHGLIVCYMELERFPQVWEIVQRAKDSGIPIPPGLIEEIKKSEKRKK